MGINRNCFKLLLYAKKFDIDFKYSLTLGRQSFFLKRKDFEKIIINSGNNNMIKGRDFETIDSELVFNLFGAETTDSLDYSNYEGATIIHDLNKPISKNLHNKYTFIFDGGSIEHIFNVPIAVNNCMRLLKIGGHIIFFTPTNNFLGHGFYQFSPEFFFRVFDLQFGFEIKKMIFFTDRKYTNFYEVSDPLKVKNRVTLSNNHPSYLFVIVKKISNIEDFEISPQQSDYENYRWNTTGDMKAINSVNFLDKFSIILKPIFKSNSSLGISNIKYFKKIKI